MNSKYIVTLATASAMALSAGAEAPAGYYDSCEGKCGKALLQQLCTVISSHTNVGYDGLWDVYADSDVYPEDGKIWDMYSTKHWPLNSQRCGNYKSVGDCYNREHSVPQSWFNSRSPMKADAFHVYPTDGKVNGQRSNYPFGECAGGTVLASNGGVDALGRLGTCTSPGYTGRVFEPDDMYKGDFARTYFYMAACYNSSVSSWSSDAFGGNDYPVFATWQTNVLMKWHAQDPVSAKETTRNDAVYRHQRNRNPFIDHPELADHIWGDKRDTPWSAKGAVEPQLTLPVDGSTVSYGLCATGVARTVTVRVLGRNISSSATVTAEGAGFSTTVSQLPASQINAGTDVAVTYKAAVAGTATGRLRITAGDITSVVNLTAEAVDGLPVAEATQVSDRSFVISWVNIDGAAARYTVDVRHDGTPVDGYPLTVAADDESHTVTGLEPRTTYTFTVASPTMTSRQVTVRTGEPLPSVDILFDGELDFVCTPGEVSEVAELLLDIDNITDDLTVSVQTPFELSSDRDEWSRSIVMLAEEERFYLRMAADTPGTYSSPITVTAGDYLNDNFEVTGTVLSSEPAFVEDFEAEFTLGTAYYTGQYQGSAALWDIHNIGMYSGGHDSANAIRFYNKDGESWIATAQPKQNGIGTISFWAKGWKPTEGVEMAVEISTDNGATWTEAAHISAYGTDDYMPYTVTVNETRPARVRFNRTSAGGRIRLDDVTITDYKASSVIIDADYHDWDAYSRDGELIVDNGSDRELPLLVYGTDGIIRHEGVAGSGVTRIASLAPGIYVVAVDDFTRVVRVR